VDDSLRSLVGPPPALPSSVSVQTPPSPPPSSPAPAASIATKPAVRLSGTRAGTIADGEARAQGYNVNDYRRSEAIYNPAEESWAVSYEQTTANGGGKRFTVTVSDKNEKATISGR
jgi:hypothetical protein